MNVEVHTYFESYKDQIIDLILDIQRNEFGVPITLEAQPDLKNIHSFYQKDNGNFWIAISDNKVIARDFKILTPYYIKKEAFLLT